MKNSWEGTGNKFAQLRQTAVKQAGFPACQEDHLEVSEIDVAGLAPEEAVSKLAAQNAALVAHVRKLQGANYELKKEVAFLQGEQKRLETQLAEKTQQIRSLEELQASHKASLQQLQEACEGTRDEAQSAELQLETPPRRRRVAVEEILIPHRHPPRMSSQETVPDTPTDAYMETSSDDEVDS